MGFSNSFSRLIACALLSAGAVSLPAQASSESFWIKRSQPVHVAMQNSSPTIDALLSLTNQERERKGLASVSLDHNLSIAAQRHADDLARSGEFSHTGSDGSAFDERIKATGYDFKTASENIYMQGPRNLPKRVVAGWMKSQGHRDNILNDRFTEVGFGYAEVDNRHYYVQVFGTPKAQAKTTAARPTASRPFTPSTPAATIAQAPTLAQANVSTADSVLALTNQERSQKGLVSLSPSEKLNAAAQSHAEDMARSGKLSHTGSDGSSMGDRIKASGYRLRLAGENIAYRAPDDDPAGTITSWMGSKGHRENILNSQFTEIGIGYATDGRRHYYVQVFGRPR